MQHNSHQVKWLKAPWSSMLEIFWADKTSKPFGGLPNILLCKLFIIQDTFTVVPLCRLDKEVCILCSSHKHLELTLIKVGVASAELQFTILTSVEVPILYPITVSVTQ